MFKGQAQESIRKPAGNKDDQAPKDWDVEVILSGKKKPQLLMTFSKVGICWLLLTFFWGKESLCVLTRGDGEQLHPDLQRILELELNDYHFLCPGYPGPGVLKLSQLWKAQEIYGCLLWTWSLDMIWIDMDWYGLIWWVGFSISMLVYLLMDKPWDSWWFYVKNLDSTTMKWAILGWGLDTDVINSGDHTDVADAHDAVDQDHDAVAQLREAKDIVVITFLSLRCIIQHFAGDTTHTCINHAWSGSCHLLGQTIGCASSQNYRPYIPTHAIKDNPKPHPEMDVLSPVDTPR